MSESFAMRILNKPIKYKLMFMSMATSFIAVIIVCVIFIGYSVNNFKHSLYNEFDLVSDVIASNVAPFIQFMQVKPAKNVLKTLSVEESIRLVCAYDANDQKFAAFSPDLDNEKAMADCINTPVIGHYFDWDNLYITKEIRAGNEVIGKIHIITDLRKMKRDIQLYLLGMSMILIVIMLIAYAISSKIQKVISGPIMNLTKLAKKISQSKEYSERAKALYDDETGVLVNSFNNMLCEIEKRDNELKSTNVNLASLNETVTTMVNSLGQGFLTFNRDGICGEVYSKACEQLLETQPAKKNITDVLKLKKDEIKLFNDWLKMMYTNGHAIPIEDIITFAPNRYNHSKGHIIELAYKPIYHKNNELSGIVMIATDITAEENTKHQLIKQQRDAAIIIKVNKNRSHFVEYMRQLKQLLALLGKHDVVIPLAEIRMEVHTLKGMAGIFCTTALTEVLHDFENKLRDLEEKSAKNNVIQIALNKYSTQILQEIENIELLVKESLGEDLENEKPYLINKDAIMSFRKFLQKNATEQVYEKYVENIMSVPIENCFNYFKEETYYWANSYGKQIMPIKITGGKTPVIADDYAMLIRSFSHICRNFIDHGLGDNEDREAAGKNPKGSIGVNISVEDKASKNPMLKIVIKDDGAGIDPARIRRKMKEVSPEVDLTDVSDSDVIQNIFNYGFSTTTVISQISGNGIGLSALKEEAEKLGGSVYVESKVGKGCSFYITVPYTT